MLGARTALSPRVSFVRSYGTPDITKSTAAKLLRKCVNGSAKIQSKFKSIRKNVTVSRFGRVTYSNSYMSKKHKPTGAVSKNDSAYAKADTSLHVHQRSKLKEALTIKELPWTDKQKEFIKVALDKNTKMVIADGLPGTGKTSLSIYCSLMLMNQKRVSDLIYIRSLIQAKDGETGFLSGDLAEKTMYYNVPLMDKLDELLPKSQANLLITDERITCYPTSMLRGYNFAVKAVIAEEAQNMSFDSLLTATTRMAEHSKMFVLGDTKYQNDLGRASGFDKFCDIFDSANSRYNGVHYFHFGKEDIVRSEFVRFVMEEVEDYENSRGE